MPRKKAKVRKQEIACREGRDVKKKRPCVGQNGCGGVLSRQVQKKQRNERESLSREERGCDALRNRIFTKSGKEVPGVYNQGGERAGEHLPGQSFQWAGGKNERTNPPSVLEEVAPPLISNPLVGKHVRTASRADIPQD